MAQYHLKVRRNPPVGGGQGSIAQMILQDVTVPGNPSNVINLTPIANAIGTLAFEFNGNPSGLGGMTITWTLTGVELDIADIAVP